MLKGNETRGRGRRPDQSDLRRRLRKLRRRVRAARLAFAKPKLVLRPAAEAPVAAPVAVRTPAAVENARMIRRHLPDVRPRSAPGTRKTQAFFDEYPRFFETSRTTPFPWRLNLRYDAIFGENRDVFEGARVLDIASHDGRWSLAALKTGAASVVGIEGRPDLVEHAEQNMAHYGIDAGSYQFIAGDIYDVLARDDMKFDVVMCLGFMYHTLRYNELLHDIAQCSPRHLIIDTNATAMPGGALVRVRTEKAEMQRNAIADDFSFGADVLTGYPSAAALKLMVEAYGFDFERWSDWGGLLRDNPGWSHCHDYRQQRRITLRAKARRP